MIRIFLFLAVLIGSFFNAQSQPINSLHPCKIANGKMAHFRDTTDCKKSISGRRPVKHSD